jgi:hypothetical protein
MTLIAAVAVTLVPFLAVAALLGLAHVRDRRRAERMARQVAVTDAIHRELGAIVAPVVDKPVLGPWRLRIPVPFERPALVARVLAAAGPALPGPVQVVLVPRRAGAR